MRRTIAPGAAAAKAACSSAGPATASAKQGHVIAPALRRLQPAGAYHGQIERNRLVAIL